MSPILGAQNLIDNPSSQLLRSKSLNDISNNSLVLAPDLSVNFQGSQHLQQLRQTSNHLLDNIGSNLITSYDTQQQQHQQLIDTEASALRQTSNGTTCMNMVDYYKPDLDIYHLPQPDSSNSCTTTVQQSNNHAFTNHLTNGQVNQQQMTTFFRDPNDNQCSNKQNTSNVANSTSATNMFNICNPIVMNLNGVTEQIGNLHL